MSRKKSRKRPALRQRRTVHRWTPYVVLGGVLLLSLTAIWVWRGLNDRKAAVEVTGAPSLKTDRERVDLGDVRLGQTVEVNFELANVGDRQLRFTEAPYIEVVEGC